MVLLIAKRHVGEVTQHAHIAMFQCARAALLLAMSAIIVNADDRASSRSVNSETYTRISTLSWTCDGTAILAAAAGDEAAKTTLRALACVSAVQILDAQSLCVRRTIACSPDGFASAAFANNDSLIAVCGSKGGLQLYTREGINIRATIPDKLSYIDNFAITPDGVFLAATSGDQIIVSRLRNWSEEKVVDLRGETVHGIAFIPGSPRLVIGGRTLRVVSLDPKLDEPETIIWKPAAANEQSGEEDSNITSVAVSSDGRLIAAATGAHVIFHDICDSKTSVLGTTECGIDDFFGVDVSRDGSYVLITGHFAELKRNRTRNDSGVPARKQLPLADDEIRDYGSAVVWNVRTKTVDARFTELGMFSAAALSPNSTAIAMALKDGRICVVPFNARNK